MTKKVILLVIVLIAALGFLSYSYFSGASILKKSVDTSWNTIQVSQKLAEEFGSKTTFVEDADSATFMIGSWKTIFSKSKDPNLQLRALQEVVTRLRMDTGKAWVIDLRYNKVVIKNP